MRFIHFVCEGGKERKEERKREWESNSNERTRNKRGEMLLLDGERKLEKSFCKKRKRKEN